MIASRGAHRFFFFFFFAHTRRYGADPSLPTVGLHRSQAALEPARIFFVGASATSISILKNIVLPAIGYFTILDPAFVSPEDAGKTESVQGCLPAVRTLPLLMFHCVRAY
jgi:hypothetical protein